MDAFEIDAEIVFVLVLTAALVALALAGVWRSKDPVRDMIKDLK